MVQSNLTETAWEADSSNTLLEENGHSESYVSEQAMLRLASIAESCRPSDPLLVPMLQQLLPQLRQEDAPLLPARQRRRLFQLMQRSGKPSLFRPANIPLATILMRVLAVDGERKTLEYILKTATAVPWRPHHFPMQMVARECLPSLRGKHCEDGSFPEGLTSQEEERPVLNFTMTTLRQQYLTEIQSLQLPNPVFQPLSIPALEALLEALQRAVQQRRRRNGIGRCLLVLTSVQLGWAILTFHVGKDASTVILPALFAGLCAMLALLRPEVTRIRNIVRTLGNTQDLRVIGPLLEALGSGEKSGMYAYSAAILARLLPNLTPNDAATLTDYQRTCLYSTLLPRQKESEFVASALKVLVQLGDWRAVPAIEKLAKRRAKTAAQKRVKQVATACLPSLKRLAIQETLLRSSSAHAVPTEQLLRPTLEKDHHPEQLLRST